MNAEELVAAIEALQAEVAFQGDSVQQLNEALATQQKDLLLLNEKMELLAKQLRDLRAQQPATDAPTDEPPPPHY